MDDIGSGMNWQGINSNTPEPVEVFDNDAVDAASASTSEPHSIDATSLAGTLASVEAIAGSDLGDRESKPFPGVRISQFLVDLERRAEEILWNRNEKKKMMAQFRAMELEWDRKRGRDFGRDYGYRVYPLENNVRDGLENGAEDGAVDSGHSGGWETSSSEEVFGGQSVVFPEVRTRIATQIATEVPTELATPGSVPISRGSPWFRSAGEFGTRYSEDGRSEGERTVSDIEWTGQLDERNLEFVLCYERLMAGAHEALVHEILQSRISENVTPPSPGLVQEWEEALQGLSESERHILQSAKDDGMDVRISILFIDRWERFLRQWMEIPATRRNDNIHRGLPRRTRILWEKLKLGFNAWKPSATMLSDTRAFFDSFDYREFLHYLTNQEIIIFDEEREMTKEETLGLNALLSQLSLDEGYILNWIRNDGFGDPRLLEFCRSWDAFVKPWEAGFHGKLNRTDDNQHMPRKARMIWRALEQGWGPWKPSSGAVREINGIFDYYKNGIYVTENASTSGFDKDVIEIPPGVFSHFTLWLDKLRFGQAQLATLRREKEAEVPTSSRQDQSHWLLELCLGSERTILKLALEDGLNHGDAVYLCADWIRFRCWYLSTSIVSTKASDLLFYEIKDRGWGAWKPSPAFIHKAEDYLQNIREVASLTEKIYLRTLGILGETVEQSISIELTKNELDIIHDFNSTPRVKAAWKDICANWVGTRSQVESTRMPSEAHLSTSQLQTRRLREIVQRSVGNWATVHGEGEENDRFLDWVHDRRQESKQRALDRLHGTVASQGDEALYQQLLASIPFTEGMIVTKAVEDGLDRIEACELIRAWKDFVLEQRQHSGPAVLTVPAGIELTLGLFSWKAISGYVLGWGGWLPHDAFKNAILDEFVPDTRYLFQTILNSTTIARPAAACEMTMLEYMDTFDIPLCEMEVALYMWDTDIPVERVEQIMFNWAHVRLTVPKHLRLATLQMCARWESREEENRE